MDKKLAILLLGIAVMVTGNVLSDGSPALADDELIVDNDLLQCPAAAFTTIQAAVTTAAGMPGSQKIHVCEGTYPENVSIGAGNSVEIFGDGTDKTFVTGVAGTPGPIFNALDVGEVVIEKLTVDGMSALAGGLVWGIRYQQTSGRIKDTAVLNIRNPNGASQGLGIRVESTTGAPTKVRVEDNLVQNFTRVGISANGIGVDVRVEDNRVIGPVTPKVWAPNGIQVSRGAVGLVKGNEVRDATSPTPPAGAGSGILLFCAGASRVEGNKVFTSDLGVALGDNANASVIGNEVSDSVFEAYSLQFIGTLFGPLGCPAFPSPTTGNLLEGNKGFNSAENGLSLANFDPNNPMPPTNNQILNTDIKGSVIDGIHVFGGSGNSFINNQIDTSGDHGAEDDTVGTGTSGTANTWQDNDCKNSGTAPSEPAGLCKGD